MNQQTLNKSFSVEGKGLHTGEDCRISVHPGAAGTGYVVKCGKEEAKVLPYRIDGNRHRTTITLNKGTEIHTLEHLLASLYAMQVDNAIIEVEAGNEIPGCDGSALEFAQKISESGMASQEEESEFFQLTHDLSAGAYGCSITATPIKEKELRISYLIDYSDSSLAKGVVEKVVTPEVFLKEIAPARTFVMQSQAEALQKAGYGKGANTQNTLVLNGDEVVNNTLRFDMEPAAHKILDIIGDLAVTGRKLGAHIMACKSGHALNQKLAGDIFMKAIEEQKPGGLMNIKDIEGKLPHRYPFLLVDRVLYLDPMRHVVAYKNLTRNEPFFNGHFPGDPIMPGVLMIEALAQAGAVSMLKDKSESLAVLTGVDNVKSRRQVVPGDCLMLTCNVLKYNGRVGSMSGRATVNGELACSATIKFAFINRSTGVI